MFALSFIDSAIVFSINFSFSNLLCTNSFLLLLHLFVTVCRFWCYLATFNILLHSSHATAPPLSALAITMSSLAFNSSSAFCFLLPDGFLNILSSMRCWWFVVSLKLVLSLMPRQKWFIFLSNAFCQQFFEVEQSLSLFVTGEYY